MTPKDIAAVFNRHDSDKSAKHSYEHLYYLIRPIVQCVAAELKSPSMLEIGYLKGAGIQSFRALFPRIKHFYSLDCDFPRQVPKDIHKLDCDTGDLDALRKVAKKLPVGQFALVVDDGSHLIDHCANNLECFWPLLAPGGIYVVEDLQGAAAVPHIDDVDGMVIDLRAYKGQYDDLAYVLIKP